MPDEAVIYARGLKKSYGSLEAVRGIDLEVAEEEIFGFLGPNGAGKSTTISMLCTLLRPTGGQAFVAGIDVDRDPSGVRARIGLVFQDPSLDDQLTARENLELHALIYRVPGSAAEDRRGSRGGAALRSSRRSGSNLLRRREGITLFMTTHYMDEAEFCDRIAVAAFQHRD